MPWTAEEMQEFQELEDRAHAYLEFWELPTDPEIAAPLVGHFMRHGVPPLPNEPKSTPRHYRVIGLKDDGSRVSVTEAVTDEGARRIKLRLLDANVFPSVLIEPYPASTT